MMADQGERAGLLLAWQRLQGRPMAQWPVQAQFGAALLLAAGLSVAAGLVLLRMEQEALAGLEARQQALQSDYRKHLAEVAALPALRARMQAMEQQQAAHAALAPRAAQEGELLSAWHRAAAAQGLQLGRLQPGKEKLQEAYARQWLQLRAEGGYQGVTGMLAALQGLPWSVVPERWSLAPDRSRSGRSRGALVWQGKFAVYRFALAGERPVRKGRKTGGKTS